MAEDGSDTVTVVASILQACTGMAGIAIALVAAIGILSEGVEGVLAPPPAIGHMLTAGGVFALLGCCFAVPRLWQGGRTDGGRWFPASVACLVAAVGVLLVVLILLVDRRICQLIAEWLIEVARWLSGPHEFTQGT